MSLETGALLAMSIGILGGALLTVWCLYSQYCERKGHRQ